MRHQIASEKHQIQCKSINAVKIEKDTLKHKLFFNAHDIYKS